MIPFFVTIYSYKYLIVLTNNQPVLRIYWQWMNEWINAVYRQVSNFSAIPWRDQVTYRWDDDDVYFVLDHHNEFYIVLDHHTEFYFVLHHHTEFYFVLDHHTEFYFVLDQHTEFYFVLDHHTLSSTLY